jgi:hypothetical protein
VHLLFGNRATQKTSFPGILQFDAHNKATMVNDLMMALVSEHHVQPVMSTVAPKA